MCWAGCGHRRGAAHGQGPPLSEQTVGPMGEDSRSPQSCPVAAVSLRGRERSVWDNTVGMKRGCCYPSPHKSTPAKKKVLLPSDRAQPKDTACFELRLAALRGRLPLQPVRSPFLEQKTEARNVKGLARSCLTRIPSSFYYFSQDLKITFLAPSVQEILVRTCQGMDSPNPPAPALRTG